MSADDQLRKIHVAHVQVSASGADAVADALNRSYPMGFVLDGLRPHAELSIQRSRVGPLCVDEVRTPGRFRFEAGELDSVMVGRVKKGSVQFTAGQLSNRFQPGQCYMTGQPGEPFLGAVDDMVAQVVTLGLDRFAATAGYLPDDTPGPLRFHRLHSPTPSLDALWATVADHAADTLARKTCTPLGVEAAAHLLAATALTVFPNTYVDRDPLAPGPGHVGTTTLQRAVAFVDANADRPLTLADIAQASGVTGRALQYAFRRVRGTTPLGYLRRVRLERARTELKAADRADGTTVAQVGAHWGWNSPRGFAAAYRRAFGSTPSETLGS